MKKDPLSRQKQQEYPELSQKEPWEGETKASTKKASERTQYKILLDPVTQARHQTTLVNQ